MLVVAAQEDLVALSHPARTFFVRRDRVAVDAATSSTTVQRTRRRLSVVAAGRGRARSAQVDRPDPGLEHSVAEPTASIVTLAVAAGVGAVEDRAERELEILQRLDRQVETERETAEHEMRDAMEFPLAREGERDLVGSSHAHVPQLLLEIGLAPRARPPSRSAPLAASRGARATSPNRARRRSRARRASEPAA